MVDSQGKIFLTLAMVRIDDSTNQKEMVPVALSVKGALRGMMRLAPISVFVVPFGVGFGIAAIEQGLTVVQAVAMSAVVFSGAAQFASLEFWPEPVGLTSIALVMFAVNARFIITGAALSTWLNQLPILTRWFSLSFLSDPNFVDSRSAFQAGEKDVGVFLGGGLILWLTWVGGTVLGALAGENLGDLKVYGFDVVMVCFFATAITSRLKPLSAVVPAFISAAIAIATLDLLPLGWNIIAASVAGGMWGAYQNAV
ncbi:AzlC protein [Ruegeria meonggei]|uniref:AzlC protein n=2 Tax=Ruegeria meonggei TaxID=1446476 RepID=A0A1X6YXN2_9RHOB|nr:AzlC protein [Ruegeria meonggei]